MNILLINHYAGSPRHGMEYRPWYMARAWQRLGHRTRVVAARFSHVRSVQPDSGNGFAIEDVDGVEYCWVPAGTYGGNGLGRVRNISRFVWGLYRHAADLTSGFRPDAVISSSTYPLDAFPASRISRRHGGTFVHEIHDLWPLSPIELGNMPRWHPFIATMQVAENYAYAHADAVVSMLPAAERHMRQHGLAPGKFVYVPNGIDTAEWDRATNPVPEGALARIREARARFPFLVGYAGAHGIANALDALVDSAKLLWDAGVAIVLVGDGPEKPRLARRVKELALPNVVFVDPVRKASIPALLRELDVAYIGLKRQSVFRFGVSPNKLMDYMMAARPVLHAIEAGNDLVADAGCGISVAAEDPAAIAEAARRLRDASPENLRSMGERGRDYILRHHTYDVLAPRFLEVLRR